MKIEKLSNFSKIYNQYDVFLIDLWGVMHNGIRLNPGAIKTVENLSNNNKKIRTQSGIRNFSRRLVEKFI